MERLNRQQKTAAIVLLCVFVMGVALFTRRLAGAISQNLASGEAALYAGLFATVVVAALRSLQRPTMRLDAVGRSVIALILSLVFVAGLTNEPLTVLACLVAVAAVIGLSDRGSEAVVTVSSAVTEPSAASDAPVAQSELAEELSADAEDPAISFGCISLHRQSLGDVERIEGAMALEFGARELTKMVHVPLWPPLASEPAVECQLEGLDGRVRVPLAKRHGFRIEVRLPEECDEPLAGTLRFTATAACRAAAA